MPKILYHGELRGLGPVKVTVEAEPVENPKRAHSFLVALKIGDDHRLYQPENQACCDFWAGKKGQTFTIVAEGQREEAAITFVGQSGAEVKKPAPKAKAVAPAAEPLAAIAPITAPIKPKTSAPMAEPLAAIAPVVAAAPAATPTSAKCGMRITELRYDRTVNTGNYCNEKIGITLQIEDGTKAADVLAAARAFVDKHQAKEEVSKTGGRI